MVVSREGNLFALLGSDVEDDPEFILPTKKKDLKVEKKKKKQVKAKTEDQQLTGLKVPLDTRPSNRSIVVAKPSAVIKSNNREVRNPTGAPKPHVTQQKINNPTINRNNINNNNGYIQRNLVNGAYKGGFRDDNSYNYQQRNTEGKDNGNVGYTRRGSAAGDHGRHERKISGDYQKVVVVAGQDNDDNLWCYVGRKGKVSKKGSVSDQDLNSTKSESIHEGSEYSSRTLEHHSSLGQPADKDNQSVQTTSDQGDAQVNIVGEGSKKKSMGKSTDQGLRNTKPKEEQEPEKPTFTLKEYEAQQAEKRKASKALKRSEERKVEDKDFESFKLMQGKKGKKKTRQSVEEAVKADTTNKERTDQNKAPKAIRITEFLLPDNNEILIEKPDRTWHLVKEPGSVGRVIRRRRFRVEKEKDGGDDNSGSEVPIPVPVGIMPVPPLDEKRHFPGLR